MSFFAGMRHCPKCAAPFAAGGFEAAPAPTCAACGFVFYRGPALAAGCLVEEAGRLLLAKRRYEPWGGAWYIPSGFVEYGESPEAGAAREMREETGLTVRVTGLFTVGDERDDPRKQVVVLFYRAARVAGEAAPHDDVSELGWFAPDALPQPIAFGAHAAVIAQWAAIMRRDD